MKWFRLKCWLARRSKRLDQKFTKDFWKWQHNSINKIIDNLELRAGDIRFIKRK